jgi:putative membrane protein insertion efficiency factor
MFKPGVIRAIRFYQRAISPLTRPSCRFTPTCSEYAVGVIDRYGALSGGWLAFKRILRCHPFGGQGYDPVPGVTASETMVGDACSQNTYSAAVHSREDMR